MSTILKALRRLEEEQGAQGERPLREAVAAEPQRRRGPVSWRLAAALVVAVGGGSAALAFWSVLDEAPRQQASAPVLPPAPAAAASASVPAAAEPFEAAPRRPEPRHEPVETAAVGELPEAAYASPVERMDRPPAELRISAVADVPVETERTTAAVRAVRRVPVDELPGRHQRPDPIAVAATAAPTPPPAEPTRAQLPRRTVSSPVAPTPVASEQTLPAPARPEPDPWEEPPVPAPSPAPTAVTEPPAPSPAPTAVAKPRVPSPTPTAAAKPRVPSPTPTAAAKPRVPSPTPTAVAKPRVPSPTPTAAAKPPAASPAPTAVAKPPAPSPAPTTAAKPPAPKSVAKAESPGVRVERTAWHPSAARRTAVVAVASGEEREVHEGDEVGSLLVSKIEPSGVVFLDQGVEVRRRVGER